MTRIFFSALALAMLALVGVAVAHGGSSHSSGHASSHVSVHEGPPTTTLPNTGTPGYDHGNQECHLIANDTDYPTPGAMFRGIRETPDGAGQTGDNPVKWLDSYPAFMGTVGDFIERNCQELR